MGGTNPYITSTPVAPATQPVSITFLLEGETEGTTITVPPQTEAHTGLVGSVLDIALNNGIEIDHACGGVVACSTCHIIVESGLESCNPSTDDEEDQLEKAPGLTPRSRLACQCVPNGSAKLTVRIPSWNRNLVRE